MESSSNGCCAVEVYLLQNVMPPLISVEVTFGVVGSGLALWIFCCYIKPWKSSTVLLFNLALADFLLILVLPFRVIYYRSGLEWNFGPAFCRISLFMLASNRTGSILFLTAVAVDRYIRVTHPHHSLNSMTLSKAAGVAVGLWMLTFSLNVLILIPTEPVEHQCESFVVCQETGKAIKWHKFVYFASFSVPLLINLFCSAQIIVHLRRRKISQNKTMKRSLWYVTGVVAMFALCYFPSNVTQFLIWVKSSSLWTCKDMSNLTTAFYLTISLTYLNSMLNPVVYCFSSPSFERIFRRLLKIVLRKRTRESKLVSTQPVNNEMPSSCIPSQNI